MPIYDGNDKINTIFVTIPQYDIATDSVIDTTVEIREVRLGSTPLFPDSVGQITINSFEVFNADGSALTSVSGTANTSLMYRVEGQPGATFLVDALSAGISISSSIITLDSSGSYEQGFTALAQSRGAGERSLVLRLLPTGSTGIEEELETLINISQAAGQPEPALNDQGPFFSGTTRASVSPSSGSRQPGSQFTVTLPSGMFNPPSGWVVERIQWGVTSSFGTATTPSGIYDFPAPTSNTYTIISGPLQGTSYTRWRGIGTVVYRLSSDSSVREGRAYEWIYDFND